MPAMIKDKEARDNLAANVTRILEERGITQAVLAKATGDPRMAISRICRGLHVPSVAIVARIAEALDVSMDRLVAAPPQKKNSPARLTA